MPKNKISIIFTVFLLFLGCQDQNNQTISSPIENETTNQLVAAAREQIGIVTHYDTSYYVGGYPPQDRGACTDVIEQALRQNGYDLKSKIDEDMKNYPTRYSNENDPNINFRRVTNVKTFLDHYALELTTKTDSKSLEEWQAGDIVTYDQIPDSLWHIAIVSDQKNSDGIPLLIHNYGKGVVEDDFLINWPAPITGHYRLQELTLNQ